MRFVAHIDISRWKAHTHTHARARCQEIDSNRNLNVVSRIRFSNCLIMCCMNANMFYPTTTMMTTTTTTMMIRFYGKKYMQRIIHDQVILSSTANNEHKQATKVNDSIAVQWHSAAQQSQYIRRSCVVRCLFTLFVLFDVWLMCWSVSNCSVCCLGIINT